MCTVQNARNIWIRSTTAKKRPFQMNFKSHDWERGSKSIPQHSKTKATLKCLETTLVCFVKLTVKYEVWKICRGLVKWMSFLQAIKVIFVSSQFLSALPSYQILTCHKFAPLSRLGVEIRGFYYLWLLEWMIILAVTTFTSLWNI